MSEQKPKIEELELNKETLVDLTEDEAQQAGGAALFSSPTKCLLQSCLHTVCEGAAAVCAAR
jgi:hypothetical protein